MSRAQDVNDQIMRDLWAADWINRLIVAALWIAGVLLCWWYVTK